MVTGTCLEHRPNVYVCWYWCKYHSWYGSKFLILKIWTHCITKLISRTVDMVTSPLFYMSSLRLQETQYCSWTWNVTLFYGERENSMVNNSVDFKDCSVRSARNRAILDYLTAWKTWSDVFSVTYNLQSGIIKTDAWVKKTYLHSGCH